MPHASKELAKILINLNKANRMSLQKELKSIILNIKNTNHNTVVKSNNISLSRSLSKIINEIGLKIYAQSIGFASIIISISLTLMIGFLNSYDKGFWGALPLYYIIILTLSLINAGDFLTSNDYEVNRKHVIFYLIIILVPLTCSKLFKISKDLFQIVHGLITLLLPFLYGAIINFKKKAKK
jgi:hypothetical protein